MRSDAPWIAALATGVAVAGILGWLNVQTRLTVSESPSLFGMPWALCVHMSRGWPCDYYHGSVTDLRERVVKNLQDKAGRQEYAAMVDENIAEYGINGPMLAVNVGAGVFMISGTAAVAWWVVRQVVRRRGANGEEGKASGHSGGDTPLNSS